MVEGKLSECCSHKVLANAQVYFAKVAKRKCHQLGRLLVCVEREAEKNQFAACAEAYAISTKTN